MSLNDARITPSRQVTIYAQDLSKMQAEIASLRLELTNAKVVIEDWITKRPVHGRDDHDCDLCLLYRQLAEALRP